LKRSPGYSELHLGEKKSSTRVPEESSLEKKAKDIMIVIEVHAHSLTTFRKRENKEKVTKQILFYSSPQAERLRTYITVL